MLYRTANPAVNLGEKAADAPVFPQAKGRSGRAISRPNGGPKFHGGCRGMRPERGAGIRPREKSDLKSVKKGGLYLKFQGMNFIIKLIIALKWVKVGN